MTDSTHLAGMTWGWGAVFGLVNLVLGGGAFAAWLKKPPRHAEEQAGCGGKAEGRSDNARPKA
ncbi:MAG: hypothetical protein EOO38_11960 [Cytophagaceae bacterium]|nr:MAG: hypothetical protein EOO38_11960 [Cytophagaceae bacterium]